MQPGRGRTGPGISPAWVVPMAVVDVTSHGPRFRPFRPVNPPGSRWSWCKSAATQIDGGVGDKGFLAAGVCKT